MRIAVTVVISIVTGTAGPAPLAQSPAATDPPSTPKFEVASVRPSPPVSPGRLRRQGMTTDAGRVDIVGFPLTTLIPLAFRVPQSQVIGPDWMAAQGFDIHAKMPEGASEDQIPEMLRGLLVDRFKLAMHRENKEQAVYALLVAKGDLKLKPTSTDVGALAHAAAADLDKPPPPAAVVPLGGGQVRVTDDPNGRGGTVTGLRTGTVRMAMGSDGTMHMEAPNMALEGLADLLVQLLRQPVIDMTGLKGRFQIVLQIPRGDGAGGVRAAQAQTRGAGGPDTPAASDPTENPIFAAVQKLGLKLESRKMPVETIVVDHLEKTPTEN